MTEKQYINSMKAITSKVTVGTSDAVRRMAAADKTYKDIGRLNADINNLHKKVDVADRKSEAALQNLLARI